MRDRLWNSLPCTEQDSLQAPLGTGDLRQVIRVRNTEG